LNRSHRLPSGLVEGAELPLLALAPMQYVTNLAFMRVVSHYGAPDYFFTEYFRVHANTRLDQHILSSITENDSGRPVFAQLIGHDPALLAQTARALLAYPIAGIDLNLGCPAPKVYRKKVGGGLLSEPGLVSEILAALREAVPTLLTVKMRIGFDSTEHLERLLALLDEHGVDLLSLHGRTVAGGYRSEVRYDVIARAVRQVRCPVLANGNVTSAARASGILAETGARGLMIGRHAVRNPWIFRHCREQFLGQPLTRVTLADVREYVERLYAATSAGSSSELASVTYVKRYLNFLGPSVDPTGAFLHDMRRAGSEAELFSVCDRHLLGNGAKPLALEPYAGVLARPTIEA
jgi:tRNA-dihydrouridine synthase B